MDFHRILCPFHHLHASHDHSSKHSRWSTRFVLLFKCVYQHPLVIWSSCSSFHCIVAYSVAGALSLSWITTTTSGHTKKLTMHAVWLIGYSIGQMVSPQWWKNKYKPRNRVPWAIILVRFPFFHSFSRTDQWCLPCLDIALLSSDDHPGPSLVSQQAQ
jgi:hypothetical protein